MTPVILVDELEKYIRELVNNYWLETNQETNKPPQVLSGFLPPKRSKPEPDYPFVIVRLLEGTDKADDSLVVVKIIVGTYSEDAQNGWRDVANVLQRIRTELLTKRVVAKKFRVDYPIKFEIPEEQPYPEWVGVLTTVWTVAQPIEEVIEYGEE